MPINIVPKCRVSLYFTRANSKWNKVEHGHFSFISSNWRGEPPCNYETIVRLIAATTTAKGLRVSCQLDRRSYPVGRETMDDEMANVNVGPDGFRGDWSYTNQPSHEYCS